MSSQSKRRIHYVQSSHWDREWFKTFQDYRYQLVGMFDELLRAIEGNQLDGPFTTDGQSILIEDYLEVRPHRREAIAAAARAGHLVIGPWYVLPDEFLVSGESLIRNIRVGRQIVRDLGAEPSSAGFVSDLFGHNSQMPQILKGFGIEMAYIWRGTNLEDERHFMWEGADGTVVPTYRFGRYGYGDFGHAVRHADEADYKFDPERAKKDLQDYIEKEIRYTRVDPILIFDGWDHQEPEHEYFQLLCQHADPEKYEVVYSTFDGYQRDVLREREKITPHIRGELREPGKSPLDRDTQYLIPGVLSSRVHLKLSNHECEAALCHWAEPFSLFATRSQEEDYPSDFLLLAWKHLLQNHPHDSICGCSIDEVHRDMEYRFAQSRRIANRLTAEALGSIALAIRDEIPPDGLRLMVFHPLMEHRCGILELEIDLPEDWPQFQEFYGFESKPGFRLFDEKGEEIPYQRLWQYPSRQRYRARPSRLAEGFRTRTVIVALPLDLPPCGYRTLTVRPEEPGTPTRYFMSMDGLANGQDCIENEHLRVHVEEGGTLTLRDKTSGRVYRQLLTFENAADIGDGWYHGMAQNDEVFLSRNCSADVALMADGPYQATLRIRNRMRVPRDFDFRQMVRSTEMDELVIESFVTLRRDAKHLDVRTVVTNTAADHRVRVLFPTNMKVDHFWADSPFDAVKRDVKLRPDNHLYRELEVETKPQRSWTCVHDGECGLAVIASGLLETAVRDYEDRPIALTLFRSTRRTVFTDGEPDGLLLHRRMEFHYRIKPFSGEPDFAALSRLGQELAAGHREFTLSEKDIPEKPPVRNMPSTASFLHVQGDVVVTSLRRVGKTSELRLFNPADKDARATIDFTGRPDVMRVPKTAWPVDFESNALGDPVAVKDGRVSFDIPPHAIRTFAF